MCVELNVFNSREREETGESWLHIAQEQEQLIPGGLKNTGKLGGGGSADL